MKKKYLFIATAMLGFTANAQFTANNLLVETVGDGATALSNAAAPISLVELTTAGATVQTVTTPFTGANLLTDSGSAGSNGFFNVYNNFVGVPGYNSALGVASVAGLNTKAANILNASAAVASRTVFPTDGTIFGANNFRSVVPTSANTFYATGNGSGTTGGIWYYNGSAFTQISTTVTNLRNVEIYNGNLYFSTGSGTSGIYQVGTGLPTTTGQTATSFIATGSNSSPYGFAISPSGTVAYIADDSSVTTATGGVSKWTLSGGTWTKQYNLPTATAGLTVNFSGATPVIYAITTESSNNKIIKITDNGTALTSTDLATAGTNLRFRGIDFTPNSTILAVHDVKKSNPSITPTLVKAGETVNFSEKTDFEVYNTSGQRVSSGKNAKNFSTNGFSTGMYIVKYGEKNSVKILVK